jgi:hypothetical protein
MKTIPVAVNGLNLGKSIISKYLEDTWELKKKFSFT